MRIIAIMSYKGGVGKTTTAINLGYCLASKGFHVLLVDADQQGNATYMTTRRAYTGKTVRDAMKNIDAGPSIKRSAWSYNMDVIPATEDLEGEEYTLDTLRHALNRVQEVYDYCIIDCHPDANSMSLNAMCAADDIIIPIKADEMSINGLNIMSDYIGAIRHNYHMIQTVTGLITMYAPRRSQHQVIERIAGGMDIFDTVISASSAADSAQAVRKPITKHRKNSKPAREYMELTDEYLEKVEEVENGEPE